MAVGYVCLTLLLFFSGCVQSGPGGGSVIGEKKAAEGTGEFSTQLKINREALVNGRTEQIRVEAAKVILHSDEAEARKVILQTLQRSDTAAVAVCKALKDLSAGGESLKNSEEFIRPIVEILREGDSEQAKAAAEAMLIFDYEQIGGPLEQLVTDSSVPAAAKLNAVYALKLQPDKRAIIKLVNLLEDSVVEKEVAQAAEQALVSLGLPATDDAKSRKEIIRSLQRKGRDEFLTAWKIRQEQQNRVQQLEKELAVWQEKYLVSLGQLYEALGTDTDRGQFLRQRLEDRAAKVRLWALQKIFQWRQGTKGQLPAGLGPILVKLVSDENRDVRLQAAGLLALMVELDSAQQLLSQLKVEQDPQVRIELFVALGGRCYYGLLPNSGAAISGATRKQTLEWAARYIEDPQPQAAQKGAEVMKKLLEQDGLTAEEVEKYLVMLAERYKRQKDQANGTFRGELLNIMANMCSQSVYKAQAVRLFKDFFQEALSDQTSLVREAAVDGLINIDRTKALGALRNDFVNDNSELVRRKLIELAGEVGGADDLLWLSEKAGSGREGELAWQMMLKIFSRSSIEVLAEWAQRLDGEKSRNRLSYEQKITFLEDVELKAVGENRIKIVKAVRVKLAVLYESIGEFEKAAEYYGLLRESAETGQEKEHFLAGLLEVYLRWPKIELAMQLMDNCLLEKDLGPDNPIIRFIGNYLKEPSGAVDASSVVDKLVQIQVAQPRPMWIKQLRTWDKDFGQGNKSSRDDSKAKSE